ncbi:MAG: hypothetical protein O2968_19785 [Acidobacteria bacterium]|nr:hypothetical protein [Acidobacteriota bacterium]
MLIPRGLTLAVLLLVGPTGPAWAQDSFLEEWAAASSLNPADVRFRVRLPEGKSSWYIGEMIPLHLEFSSSSPGKWLVFSSSGDHTGFLNGVDEFNIDPASGTSDPLDGLPSTTGVIGGVFSAPDPLGSEPVEIVQNLNPWVRFEQPGSYRLYVTSSRVCHAREPEGERHAPLCSPSEKTEVVSNVVSIDITAPPVGWARGQINASLEVLDNPDSEFEERGQAVRVLRFLETPEAADAMVSRLGKDHHQRYDLRLGILSSSHRVKVLPYMEARLISPDQPVTDQFVETLAYLFMLVHEPAPAPYPVDDPSQQEAWHAQAKARRDKELGKLDEYCAWLAKAVADKETHAAGVSRKALLDYARSQQHKSTPAWLNSVVAALRESFLSLSEDLQRDLLDNHWPQLAGAEMVPILRKRYNEPSTIQRDPSIHDLTLRHLYELSPEDGRERIISQIRHPTKRIEWETLAMLSDASLPELNDELASRLEGGENVTRFIVRYADGEITDRVKAAFEKRRVKDQENKYRRYGHPDCIAPLHYYFLRYAPEYATADLDRIFAAEAPPRPVCWDLFWPVRRLGESVASPALEKLAIKYVNNHGSVAIKKGAAEVLGRFGSAAAEKPLWEAMTYFHEWWKDRKDDLENSTQSGSLELGRAYRSALAQANGWVLDSDGLSKLRDLCVSDWGRGEVSEWLRRAQSPLTIDLSIRGSGDVSAQVAQYRLRSEATLLRKLKQFPQGTAFRWENRPGKGAPPKTRVIRDRVEETIRANGGSIVP